MTRTAPPPPQAPDAEEAVLGALLLSELMPAKAIDEAVALLEPGHFYRPSNGKVFAAIRALQVEGKPLEPLLVIEELERRGDLADAGGRRRLHELATLAAVTGNAGHYARQVRDAWRKRLLQEALTTALAETANGATADDALQVAEHAILEVRERTTRGRASVIPALEIARYLEHKLKNPVSETAGVQTPFSFLRPFQPGRLYVLAGYTGDGKTTVAVQCLRAACRGNARVGFASIEMRWQELADRLVSCYGVPHKQAVTGNVSGEHRPLYERAIGDLARLNFDVIDDEQIKPDAFRRYQRAGRYDLLVIDHLHRLDWQERRDLERHVRAITNLAREFEIPVLLLAQLHRRGDDFPRPTLASIRESGMIEAEASVVAFVWRKRDEAKLPLTTAEFILAKNRFGVTRKWPLAFDADQVRFLEVQDA